MKKHVAEKPDDFVRFGRSALQAEAQAVQRASEKLQPSFGDAVAEILRCTGKVVVTGLGKSGHIAGKIASTLASTGTSAFFLHPTEALHGDLGMIQPGDCLVAIAFGGETAEVVKVAKFARHLGVPVIGITGAAGSSLAQLSSYVLDGSVEYEACPLGLAPTSSATVALALGDALAVSLMRARGFSEVSFAALHPEGSLGRKLSLVSEHMHSEDSLPRVGEAATFHDVLEAMTRNNFGIVAVLSTDGLLAGAVSDGDLRRAVLKYNGQALTKLARDLMSTKPKTIVESSLAVDAMRIMERHKCTSLFVVSAAEDRRPVGIVRMHDLLDAKIV